MALAVAESDGVAGPTLGEGAGEDGGRIESTGQENDGRSIENFRHPGKHTRRGLGLSGGSDVLFPKTGVCEMRRSALRKGLMGAALVVLAASLFAGWDAVDGVRAENARDAQLAALKETSTGIRQQGMDGLVAMVRDLAGRVPAEFQEDSDSGRNFLARMEGEMRIAHADLGLFLDAAGVVRMRHQDPGEADLLGRDLSFRRYFRSGRQGREDLYGALGAFTGRRGIYVSAPVFRQGRFQGVVVARLRRRRSRASGCRDCISPSP